MFKTLLHISRRSLGSEVPYGTVFSAKSSEPKSHELPCTSAIELVRGSLDLIETPRYSSAIVDKNQEIGSLCLQSSMGLNSSTFMGELVSISEDNCYKVTFSESVINECFSAQNLTKCSNYNELNGCTGLSSASQLYDAVRSSEVAVTASYQSLLTTPFSDECNEIENVFGGAQNLGFIASSCNEFVYVSGSADGPSDDDIETVCPRGEPGGEMGLSESTVKTQDQVSEAQCYDPSVTMVNTEDQNRSFKASAEDKENLEERFRDSTISEETTDNANFFDKFKQGNTDSNAPTKVDCDSANPMVQQPSGVLAEHNLNDLLFVSPERDGYPRNRAFIVGSRTPRGQFSRSIGTSIQRSPSSSNQLNSRPLEATFEYAGNNADIENFSISGNTPIKRGFESPSAWKSSWFMNSFLPLERKDLIWEAIKQRLTLDEESISYCMQRFEDYGGVAKQG
ncbi:hypothetical protein GIB67_024933 [Kingdonia uniflora]|uniref:Uncharacterized protein n=1 Tax=Kingdonia uniflora TaxID=39325 RepID=A0A7J7NYN0_9MAGN|nr:hypothetical protein GIB67_024933 [Kingdonia uniflora]